MINDEWLTLSVAIDTARKTCIEIENTMWISRDGIIWDADDLKLAYADDKFYYNILQNLDIININNEIILKAFHSKDVPLIDSLLG